MSNCHFIIIINNLFTLILYNSNKTKDRQMIKLIKKLLGTKEEKEIVADPPGRTFKRVLTGDYFGYDKKETDPSKIAKAKQSKIDQIKELELIPMFIRYKYVDDDVISAHVAFQKEVHAKKWNMTHVTEISLIVYSEDFDEFEQMAGVRLSEDFRDLTAYEKEGSYKGVERRKEKREKRLF